MRSDPAATRSDTASHPPAGACGPAAARAVYIVTPGGAGERGGIGRLIANIVEHWRRTGGGPAFRIVDTYGPWRLLSSPFYFAAALARILRDARRGRIALLHVHMASRGSVLRKGLIVRLGAALGLPVVLHLHSGAFVAFAGGLPAPLRRWLLATLRRADRVLVLGEAWRRIAVEELRLDPARVRVLMNAVVGPQSPPARHPEGTCGLLFLGKLAPEKGVDELLQALADPRLAGLDWRARLAGRGPVATYRARLRALGLEHRVEILGWQGEAEVRRLLAESEVFVLPSHAEGLSIAMLESLAYGLAVVATPVGAAEEVIEDGRSGLLVPVGDAEALAAALARLVAEPALRAELQVNGRRRFNENFDISGYCRKLVALYRELDEAGPRA